MGKIIKENGKIWLVELECGKHFRKTFIGVYEEEEEKAEVIEKEEITENKAKKYKKTKKSED